MKSEKSEKELATVAVKHCNSYDTGKVYEKIEELLALVGPITSFISKGDRVLVKPNMIVGRAAEKHVNTHPSVVEAVCRIVMENGGVPVIGDSPGFGDSAGVSRKVGYDLMAEKLGIEIINFTNPVEMPSMEDTHFKKFQIDRFVVESDKIINVAKLKTHVQMYMTLSVKNMYGTIVGMNKSKIHLATGTQEDAFARMLLELYKLTSPTLNIIDGIFGMEGNGPTSGTPREIGVLLGGTDGIAMDRVACEIVGVRPEYVPIFKANEQFPIGIADLEGIKILGDDIESIKINDFQPGRAGFVVPAILKDMLKKTLLTKPILSPGKCRQCGICRDNCPSDAIYDREAIIGFKYKQCIRCYCCQELCPHGAISVKDPLLSRLF